MQLLRFSEKKAPAQEGTPQFAWKGIGNYPSVESALGALVNMRLKDTEITEAKHLLWELRKTKEDIITEFQKAQVRVYENAQSG